MVDKVNMELDEAFLKKFFGLTEKIIPEDQEITMSMLRRQLDEVEELLVESQKIADQKTPYAPQAQSSQASQNTSNSEKSFDGFGEQNEPNVQKKTILIIDDLGVITYQLEVLFKQFGYDIVTSKEIYDAIEKFKKQLFDMVIMDLFIPTEREGLILLEELKKISLNKQKPTKIGIMSASSKKEHKQLCKIKGAEFYIEKIDDWQKELLRIVKEIT